MESIFLDRHNLKCLLVTWSSYRFLIFTATYRASLLTIVNELYNVVLAVDLFETIDACYIECQSAIELMNILLTSIWTDICHEFIRRLGQKCYVYRYG